MRVKGDLRLVVTEAQTLKGISISPRNGGDGEDLYLVPNAGFDMLRGVNSPVGCVSCVGPYRTGKSLLLSRFLGDSGSFRLGPTLEGCTR